MLIKTQIICTVYSILQLTVLKSKDLLFVNLVILMPRPEVTLTIADELKRARAIAEIGTRIDNISINKPFL